MNKILLFLIFICPLLVEAQQIYPIPQNCNFKGEMVYKGINTANEIVQPYRSKNGTNVKDHKLKILPSEGYIINISTKNILISYASLRGKYYAYKTLAQILKESEKTGNIPLGKITDHPDIAFRGTVEGFYGKPWSHEDRISQLRFYGDWKLNTYIYGPKDDPYHSSPKWREAYPMEESVKLKELVQIAKDNQVDFYWAIHPGQDIKWSAADSIAVLHKFQRMYDIGIRHFAVFFDDISGEGTKAEKQAGLLNYLQKEFVDKKNDVGALIMCPTEYNKGWSNQKEGTYLDILGDQLDPRIHIMWTGNTVIHDITLEGQQWVNKRIKRPSFVWWNFPVSDYVRNHLLLGESYGLDKANKSEMSGFVSNPMDKPEASKVAIFSIANYSWNLNAYNSSKTWNYAIEYLYPEMGHAYKLFSTHNTDPGPSYHQYRREESSGISEILLKQSHSLSAGMLSKLSPNEISLLKAEFEQFEPASKAILLNTKYTNLSTEIKPWLNYFSIQGQVALLLLDMNQISNMADLYTIFTKFQLLRDQMILIDQTENRNPYQPGIVTASRYVLPWVEQSYIYYHKLLKDAGYSVKDATNQPSGKLYTNIDMLKALPIENHVMMGNKVFQVLKLGKMLEFIPFNKGDYIGIEIVSDAKIREVKSKLDRKIAGFEVQYSADQKSWDLKKTNHTKFIRLINTTDVLQSVKLENFEVIFD